MYNARTLRTTTKANPPPGSVWLRVGPDQKLYATNIGFAFLKKIFEHAYFACVRSAHMALRSDDSTLETAYNYIIFGDYILFTCPAMKNRSDFNLHKRQHAGVWGKKPGVQALAWDAASRRLPAREFTKRAVFYLTDAKLKTSDVVIQWISSHLARASAEAAGHQKSLTCT